MFSCEIKYVPFDHKERYLSCIDSFIYVIYVLLDKLRSFGFDVFPTLTQDILEEAERERERRGYYTELERRFFL